MIKVFVIAAAAAASSALFAQSAPEGQTFQLAVAGLDNRFFTYSTIGGALVTGRPYSASEERHSSQTLGDGTHIETSETNRLFRDEQGRTRVERKDGTISIHDPVEGFTVELNPTTKTAMKTRVAITARYDVADGVKVREGQLLPPDPQKAEAEKRASNERAVTDLKRLTTNYQTEYAQAVGGRGGGGRLMALPTVDSPLVLRVDPGNNASVESLAPQMVNGVFSQGTRTTETIPVGKIGNDRVINIVNERWYSNDLQMLIKSSSADPRFGTTTYQLMNVVQAAPDPSLFQIPADYTMRGLR